MNQPSPEELSASSRERIEIKRIAESARTMRWLIVTVGIVACVICIVVGIVRMTERPPWLVLCLAMVAGIGPPSGIIVGMLELRRRYVRHNHKRLKSLERKIDPNRSSSEEGNDERRSDASR